MWQLVRYGLHPRSLFTHLVGGGLLYGLASQGVSMRVTVALAVVEELVAFLLWLLIPNSFATILALAFCIQLYEKVLGPRVEVSEDAILVSGKHTFLSLFPIPLPHLYIWFMGLLAIPATLN